MNTIWIPGALLTMLLCGCSAMTTPVKLASGGASPQQSEAESELSGGQQMSAGEVPLQVGDCLVVNVVTDDGIAQGELTQKVDPDGKIDVPDVGMVHVAGLMFEDVQPTIQKMLDTSGVSDRINVTVSRCQ